MDTRPAAVREVAGMFRPESMRRFLHEFHDAFAAGRMMSFRALLQSGSHRSGSVPLPRPTGRLPQEQPRVLFLW